MERLADSDLLIFIFHLQTKLLLIRSCLDLTIELLMLKFTIILITEANILALQVKLDAKENIDKKDASTQVFIGFNKKKKSKF